jgi:hypothetical protein
MVPDARLIAVTIVRHRTNVVSFEELHVPLPDGAGFFVKLQFLKVSMAENQVWK